MRYNVIGYLIGEGFRNVFKNKKSTIASIVIMCMSMLIFGMFFTIGENIDFIMTNVEEAQGMQVFIKEGTSSERVKQIGEEIKEIDGVNKTKYVSKEDALKQVKEQWKDKSDLLSGYESVFPESYVVTLTDLSLNEEVQSKIMQITDVDEITSNNQTISTLMNLANGIRIVTGVLLLILVIISIFIISNTIKLTVHARRKEISIMKYVGATNNFIRGPFLVEGIVIGVIAALISLLIVGLIYNIVSGNLMQTDIAKTIGISLLSFSDMFTIIIVVYLILGIGVGVIGSSISMRKYLDV